MSNLDFLGRVVWFLAGFTTATFLYTQADSPWVFISIMSVWLFKQLVQYLVFTPLLGGELKNINAWALSHPLSAQFWYHARQWSLGLHPTRHPLRCSACAIVR